MLVTEALTWTAAVDRCQTIGGHLVVIDSDEENDLIHQVTQSKYLVRICATIKWTDVQGAFSLFSLVIASKLNDNT